jgi:hypothetical protein
MRLCRFGNNQLGLVRQDRIIDVTTVLDHLPTFRYPLPKFDPFIAKLDSLRDHIETLADDQQGVPIAAVKLGSQVSFEKPSIRGRQISTRNARKSNDHRLKLKRRASGGALARRCQMLTDYCVGVMATPPNRSTLDLAAPPTSLP